MNFVDLNIKLASYIKLEINTQVQENYNQEIVVRSQFLLRNLNFYNNNNNKIIPTTSIYNICLFFYNSITAEMCVNDFYKRKVS